MKQNILWLILIGLFIGSCSNASNTKIRIEPLDSLRGETKEKTIRYQNVRSLSLNSIRHKIIIKAGSELILPANLGKIGLKLSKNGAAYVLEDTSKNNGTLMNGNNIIINNNNVTIQTNGTVIVNGKVVSQGTSDETSKTITIVVPPNINLKLDAINDISVSQTLNSCCLNIKGAAYVSLNEKIEEIPVISISGSGNVKVANAKTIQIVSIAGSGNISITACEQVSSLSIAGSGDVSIGNVTKIGNILIAGSGDVHIPAKTLISSKSIAGSGEIHRH